MNIFLYMFILIYLLSVCVSILEVLDFFFKLSECLI